MKMKGNEKDEEKKMVWDTIIPNGGIQCVIPRI